MNKIKYSSDILYREAELLIYKAYGKYKITYVGDVILMLIDLPLFEVFEYRPCGLHKNSQVHRKLIQYFLNGKIRRGDH